ncbi:MAG: hypothetical protein AAB538_05760, partial [Patescibacteria group bacterium]
MDDDQRQQYVVANERVSSEVNELYLIHSSFLLANTGFLAALVFKGFAENNIVPLVGVVLSAMWFLALHHQYRYKNYWAEAVRKLEAPGGVWNKAPKNSFSLMVTLYLVPILF